MDPLLLGRPNPFADLFKSLHQNPSDFYLDDITTGNAPLDYEIKSWEAFGTLVFFQYRIAKEVPRDQQACPFGTIGNEVTENDELIRQDLRVIFEVIKNKLAAFFIKEKAQARLSEEANEDQLADFCISTIQVRCL